MTRSFYMVFSPTGTTPPRARHSTEQEAIAEATRLASTHRGSEFFVMRAISRASAPPTVLVENLARYEAHEEDGSCRGCGAPPGELHRDFCVDGRL